MYNSRSFASTSYASELSNRREKNLIDDTIYGITRNLFDNINERNLKYFNNELFENLFKYTTDDSMVVEKLLYMKKHENELIADETGTSVLQELAKKNFSSQNLPDEIVVKKNYHFAENDVFNTLSDFMMHNKEITRLNNTEIEYFTTFINSENSTRTPLTWLFPLPFYCISDINCFDEIFSQLTSVLYISADKIRNKNDTYYRIWENKKHSCVIFVSEIGQSSYIRIDCNTTKTDNTTVLKQFYLLSSFEHLEGISTLQLIFDQMRTNKNIHFTERMPYNLIPFECKDLRTIYRIHREEKIQMPKLIRFINEKLPINVKFIVFGQCLDPKFTEYDLNFWLQKKRLPQSVFIWRRINCIPKKNTTETEFTAAAPTARTSAEPLQLLITLNNGKQLINLSCNIFNFEDLFSTLEIEVLPSVCMFRELQDLTDKVGEMRRIFQNSFYMPALHTTIITTSTIWPCNDLINIEEFKTFDQKLILPDLLVDTLQLNYGLELIEPFKIINKSEHAEIFILKYKYIVVYGFGTRKLNKTGRNFSLSDAIIKYLYNLKAIKNHNLIENLQHLFEILP